MSLLRKLRTNDATLSLVLALALAWPLWFVSFPPYQDLYGHGATIEVLRHLRDYPEFEASGYLRSNACITTLGVLATRFVSVPLFMKAFSSLTIFMTSYGLLRFVRAFRKGGDSLEVVPFLLPLVHHWFISMGMLNYSLGYAVVLLLVANAKFHADDPNARFPWSSLLLAALSFFCHPLPNLLGVPFALGAMYASAPDAKITKRALAGLSPLFVGALASLGSFAVHFATAKADHARIVGSGTAESLAWNEPAWVLYDAFAQSLWGMTKASISSVVVCALLVYCGLLRKQTSKRVRILFIVILALYIVTPYRAFGVYAGSPRLLLFLWPVALLAIPSKPHRGMLAAAAVASFAYVIGMNIDVFRLAKEGDHVAYATNAIPERARVLPLFFATRKVSENTRNLDSISSMYVWMRHTNAVDVWDHSSAYPIVRIEPPPAGMTRARLLAFEAKASPETYKSDCRKQGIAAEACAVGYHGLLHDFFTDAASGYSHIVLWAAPEGTIGAAFPLYRPVLHDRELVVLERTGVKL